MNRPYSSIRTQSLLALALMLIGFGFVIQMRSYEMLSERLETESEADLVEIIDQLDAEISEMRGALLEARLKLVTYESADQTGRSVIAETKKEVLELKKFLGLEAAVGPGIAISVVNEDRMLTGFDVRQIIEELRASGAWAIAVNGRRINQRSSFWRRAGYIYLDKKKLSPDMRIEALGVPHVLYQTITLPRGIRDKLSTIRGVSVKVEKVKQIQMPLSEKKELKLTEPIKQTIRQ